jgi:hypothetical protein
MKEALSMGYLSKVQVIRRGKGQRQFYLICPAPLAQALEIEKSEAIEWVVKDKWTLIVKRIDAQAKNRKGAHGR